MTKPVPVMGEKKSEAAKLPVVDKEGGGKLPVIDNEEEGKLPPVMDDKECEEKLPVKPLQFCEELVGLVGPVDIETGFEDVKQCRFEFTLTPDQIKELEGPQRKVQLRFWAKNFKEHEDDFFSPVGLALEVNGVVVPLPPRPPIIIDSVSGLPKKPPMKPKPFDIKQFIIESTVISNKLELKWSQEQISDYVMFISIVRVRSVEELLGIVKKNKQPIEVTKEVVRKMLTGIDVFDSDVASAPKNIRVPVICPIGMKRIKFPCRGKSCKHPQCFDARNFLEMSELRPTFKCPLCKDYLTISNLYIDEYFENVLCTLDTTTSMANVEYVEIQSDGNWNPVLVMKKNAARPSSNYPPSKRPRNDYWHDDGVLPFGVPTRLFDSLPGVGGAKPSYGVSGLYPPNLRSMPNSTPTPTFQSQRMFMDLSGYELGRIHMAQQMRMQGWQPTPNYGGAFQNNGFGPRSSTNGLGMNRRPSIPLPSFIPVGTGTLKNPSPGGPSLCQVPVSTKPKPQPQIVDLIDSDEEISQSENN